MSGGPVHRYGVYAGKWIIEVNGKPLIHTLKQDLHYWPTRELKFVVGNVNLGLHIIYLLNQ